MEFSHYSVMLPECMDGLAIRGSGVYLDGTAGGGGHSIEIAKRLTTGRLICLDQDPDAVKAASERLRDFACAQVVQANFKDMREVLDSLGVPKLDGVLLDLGVSSYQLDQAERGFSYNKDALLDMRMSQSGRSARELVNEEPVDSLAAILRDYGEERFAYKIALNIDRRRKLKPIETTLELGEIIKEAVPAASRREKNPCKRSFQAIRIAVNGELDALQEGLTAAFDSLNTGGRLVVLTFHSIEDRMVKKAFAEFCTGCTCPPEFPVCVCHKKPRGRLVNKKPITADAKELEINRRSHSAKLRIIEKIRNSIYDGE